MNQNRKRFVLSITALIIMTFITGCAHQLEIKNMRTYRSMELHSPAKKISVGIIPTIQANDYGSLSLVKGISSELAKQVEVILPYLKTSSRKVDVIAQINIKSEYKGSFWNLPINFPGFLIFVPAWHGYVYRINYDVDISLTKAYNNETINAFSVPIYLKIRHADISRTWTVAGGFLAAPPVSGAIPLIGGICFIQYDDDVTPLAADKIQIPIGDYIAQKIIAKIKNIDDIGSSR